MRKTKQFVNYGMLYRNKLRLLVNPIGIWNIQSFDNHTGQCLSNEVKKGYYQII